MVLIKECIGFFTVHDSRFQNTEISNQNYSFGSASVFGPENDVRVGPENDVKPENDDSSDGDGIYAFFRRGGRLGTGHRRADRFWVVTCRICMNNKPSGNPHEPVRS